MNIELDIDELVIHGLTVQDPDQLKSVVSAELARLLAKQGLPPALTQGGVLPSLSGGAVTIRPGTPERSVGSQIANAVYGSFSR